MSIKPTMETRQNIQRCDWYVNAHNASSVPLPQQDPEEDSLTYR